jgi:cyclopropane fatty-acyl-phospholipid synthase-like methyltransferase
MSAISRYHDAARVAEAVRNGGHRDVVGGMWEEIGALQIDFLRSQGLKPRHYLLDVGCGSLRGGVRFVDYLDPSHYFGIDINQSLLDAGYEIELKSRALRDKLPRENLLCDPEFAVERFDRNFDFALGLSVFTHLPLNHIRVCLERLRPCLSPGGAFFATYFEAPAGTPIHEPFVQQPGGVTTYAARDPYHYRFGDLARLAGDEGWEIEEATGFDHPRAQRMLRFTPR